MDIKFPMRDDELLRCWPIDSIYISMTKQDPSTLFGGTWELVGENRMLMGCESTEISSSIGGSNTKFLTVENLPSHTHIGNVSSDGEHSHYIDLETTEDGLHSHTYGSTKQTVISIGGSRASANNDNNITTSEDGNHTHIVKGNSETEGAHSHVVTIDNTGNGEAFDVTNAYMKVFMYRRIS